ncbi:MAG: thioredoxin family protein [Phycisphaeraceae bacterium]
MDKTYLRTKYEAGRDYDAYLATGNDKQRESWKSVYDRAHLTGEQQTLVKSFNRTMHVIGLSGIWCGDCVQQLPLVQRIAEANAEKVHIRYLDRDEHIDLQQQVRINGGNRVPVLLFMAEDFELLGWFGDRALSRYRAVAARQLGPSCPLPGAPMPADELAATVQDWVDQFERAHLILRLSPRLRQKYED